MATVFVARELGRPVLVTSSIGTSHRVVPFRDGSALVTWIGNDRTSSLLDNLPTAEMLLGTKHERAISVFAKMLRDALDDAEMLRRLSNGIRFASTEFIVATREGTWRINHAFQVHACSYACIGDGARPAEALFGEYINLYRDVEVRSLLVHALHMAREDDNRVEDSFRSPKIDLVNPDPFTLPLQPKLNIWD